MNFKEYISEHAQLEEIIQLEVGSVLVDKEDVFKEMFKIERHSKTDKKIYSSLCKFNYRRKSIYL